MKISIKSEKQVYIWAALVGIGSVVISNMMTYVFEVFFSPPFLLQDLIVATLVSGTVAPLVSVFIFHQSLAIYNLNTGLQKEIEVRKKVEAELVQTNCQLSEANAVALAAKRSAEEARRIAESANQAKSTFLASMSHELRTPLNAVLGFSALMTQDSNLTLEQREYLEIIGRSGEHLLGLINSVLGLSKIESGKAELEPEIFDLHTMLLGLGEMFSLSAEQKGITVIFDLAPDVPRYIRADAGKLRQVLINLLGNAVKFTERGGITVRVGVTPQGERNNIQRTQ